MKQATEYIWGLRYKLHIMGIMVDEPAYVFGDNQSVQANTTAPDSTLKKKSHAIAYNFVREGCTRDEWQTTYINTNENVAQKKVCSDIEFCTQIGMTLKVLDVET